MRDDENVGALFSDHDAAEAAIDELRAMGLADEHLGVAIRGPDDHVFEEDADREMTRGVGVGMALGAPIGAVAGMTVLALVVPGGIVGLGGVLAAGGISGGLAGAYLGAVAGLGAEEHVLDEKWDWERVPIQSGEVLVVAAGHGRSAAVSDVLQRHGGRIVAEPPHL